MVIAGELNAQPELQSVVSLNHTQGIFLGTCAGCLQHWHIKTHQLLVYVLWCFAWVYLCTLHKHVKELGVCVTRCNGAKGDIHSWVKLTCLLYLCLSIYFYTCIILLVSQRCLYSGRFKLHEICPQFLAAIHELALHVVIWEIAEFIPITLSAVHGQEALFKETPLQFLSGPKLYKSR